MTDADFRDAFHRHKDVVYRFAYRMTGSGSTAEDVVQDCFVAFWRKPQAYDPERGALRPFLLGIARNVVLKRWRSERPQETLDESIEDQSCAGLPFDIEGQERAEAVKRAILLLPPLQREAVILAEYEEMSLQEIANATAADLAAVKSRLHRARQNLRRMLEPLFAIER
ncbi:MAG TPA: RNA polymerase sigma factor [Bryobacteraceae bacterium]|jgi:RNA polymerase sigma-70 factor (ECF subfamily)